MNKLVIERTVHMVVVRRIDQDYLKKELITVEPYLEIHKGEVPSKIGTTVVVIAHESS